MMASGDHLPHVVGYIEDCGYTSVWDIFASELNKRFFTAFISYFRYI